MLYSVQRRSSSWSYNMSTLTPRSQPLDVAIVGGGIIGLTLAIGLLRRNINVKIYEQAQSFREIGAGVAFSPNAQRAMKELHPDILDALHAVATANGDPENPADSFRYVDGFNPSTKRTGEGEPGEEEEELLFKLYTGKRGFDGCHRAHFLEELVKLVPEGVVEFKKRLDTYEDSAGSDKVTLKFCDGTTAQADTRKCMHHQ